MELLWKWLRGLSLLFFLSSSVWAADFKTQQIKVGGKSLKVEIAKTMSQRSQGLMFRKDFAAAEGMLFIFEQEQVLSFWMKNTFLDLSIGFFDRNKKLVDVQDMSAVKSEMEMNLPNYTSKSPALYALEVPKGWFEKHKIKIGEKLVLSSGD